MIILYKIYHQSEPINKFSLNTTINVTNAKIKVQLMLYDLPIYKGEYISGTPREYIRNIYGPTGGAQFCRHGGSLGEETFICGTEGERREAVSHLVGLIWVDREVK